MLDGLAAHLDRLGDVAVVDVRERQVRVTGVVRRVEIDQLFVGLDRFLVIAHHAEVIDAAAAVLLALRHPVEMLEGLLIVGLRLVLHLEVRVARCHLHVGHTELGIERDGLLQLHQRLARLAAAVQLLAAYVGAHRVERAGRERLRRRERARFPASCRRDRRAARRRPRRPRSARASLLPASAVAVASGCLPCPSSAGSIAVAVTR